MNSDSCRRPIEYSPHDKAIDPTAAHRNRSDGSLAVCCSMAWATVPSECCPECRPVIECCWVSSIGKLLRKTSDSHLPVELVHAAERPFLGRAVLRLHLGFHG